MSLSFLECAEEDRVLLTHKLLTPLATLSANLSLLRRQDLVPSAEERHEIIQDAEEAVDRLSRTLRALLALDDIAPGPVPGIPVSRARDLIEIEAANARLRYPFLDSSVDVRVDPGPCALPLRPEDLGVVVGNLVDNALRFRDEDPVRVLITLSSSRTAVTLSVRDNGPGVARADLPRLCEPFFQTGDPPQQTPGVGLGLTLVENLVTARGGHISFDSAPGEGLTVLIEFPR